MANKPACPVSPLDPAFGGESNAQYAKRESGTRRDKGHPTTNGAAPAEDGSHSKVAHSWTPGHHGSEKRTRFNASGDLVKAAKDVMKEKKKDIVISIRHITARIDERAYNNMRDIAAKLERPLNWVVNKILLNAKIEDIDRNS